MEISNIRTVRYFATQSAEDLYRCEENGRVYIRQRCDKNYVRWVTSSKWQGGYEADSCIRRWMVMRVVDESGAVLFEEKLIHEEGYDGTVARKIGDFADEALKKIEKMAIDNIRPQTYEKWKAWMMRSAKKHKYTGYSENWAFAEAEYSDLKVVAPCSYLGKKAYITTQTAKHRISGQTWKAVEIRDEGKQTVLRLCGFIYEEDQ